MIKKFALVAVAAAALTTASFGLSASAEARPNYHHWKRWNQPRRCVTKKVWRNHHWVVKKVCWIN